METELLRIKEDSLLARIAARKLGADSLAFTLGRTIHLHRASRQEFLENTKWLRHEMAHVEQFKKYGFLTFICLYLFETVKRGYYRNKYEVQARKAEEGL